MMSRPVEGVTEVPLDARKSNTPLYLRIEQRFEQHSNN